MSPYEMKKPYQALLGILAVAVSILVFSASALAQTDTTTPTTINVSDVAKLTNAQRLGVNLGTQNYWDSGLIMRNLAFNNPGFEGESWQSILHCKYVTATSCTDDNIYTYWPANFLAGASASFIVGPAAGTTATVTSSSLPVPGSTAVTIQLSGLSVAPSAGDYVVVRKEIPGNAGAGWWTQGNATYSTETTDLSPNTPGKQALVVNASGAGQQAMLSNFDDGAQGRAFLQLNGNYTISFRAKSTGGSTNLHINLKRNVPTSPADNFLDRDVTLTNQWQDYSFQFTLSEGTPRPSPLVLSFILTGGSMLFDDAAFTEAAGPNNPTAYRDAVVSALQSLHPGTIRYMDTGLNWGSSIDNLLAPDFARERAGYSPGGSEQASIAMGLHDFLVLCQTVGADPWFTMPTGMTTQEMSNLMDYFGGSSSTVYGAKRAALGQVAPWTTVFGQIHLEFGNEVWNTGNPGASISDAASYGKRAGTIFTTAKASPSYSAKSFDFVLDGFEALPGWTQTALQNSQNYDTADVASYNFQTFSDASSIENIYGPMLAEPEWYNSTSGGNTAEQAAVAASSGPTPAKLAIYETNVGTNSGKATQAQVAAAVPSLGAGLAVAANMLLAQRDLGVTVQNMFALEGYQVPFYGSGSSPATTSPIWGVTIDMGGATNLRRPMFLSEQLANSAILPTLLSTSQSGLNPTWSEKSTLNDTFTISAAHYIQSVAYTDGITLNVVLFNLSRTSALPVNFAGLNAPVGTATISTLTAPSIEASNENGENVAITHSSESLTAGSTLTLPPFSMTVVSVAAPVVPIEVYGVAATCPRTSLSPNGSMTCSATVTGQGKYNSSVVWSAVAGSVSASGVYTAPATLPASGKDVITATSAGDSTKSGSFQVAIAPNAITGVTASCAASTLSQGAVTQCTAAVAGTGGFSNAYTWSAPAGSFSSTGKFTAPMTGSSVVVKATSTQDPTKSASVSLNLTTALAMSTPIVTVTGTTATLQWKTNLNAFAGVEYGKTTVPSASTPFVNSAVTNQNVTITGLSPSTTYYMFVFSYAGPQMVSQNIVATTASATTNVSSVSISCSATTLALGGSTACAATVHGNASTSSAVTWATTLGSISSTGVLTAPLTSTATSMTVTATSVQDPTKSGSLTIALNAPSTVSGVTVACQPSTIQAGGTTTCSSTVTGTGNISKAVTFAASAGTITSAGVLTAPTTGTSVLVTATSVQDPTKSASATITLTPAAAITGVTVSCQPATIQAGGNTTCSPVVTGTGNISKAVTFAASAGTITSAGVLTAPTTGTSVLVTATSVQDPTKSGSATITLTPLPTITGVKVSCQASSLAIGGNTTCSSTVTGTGSYNSGVTWSASAGSITASGAFTAPSSGTSVLIRATSTEDTTKSGSATITLTGGMTISGVTSAATSTTATITWTTNIAAYGGINYGTTPTSTSTTPFVNVVGTTHSFTLTGLLPSTTYYLYLVSYAGQQSTTKIITVTTAAAVPTVTGVTIKCSGSTLSTGSSEACSSAVTGTGNYSSAVSWSASAGTITQAGVLTAPATATSVTVKATSVQDPTKSASTTVNVTSGPTITGVTVSCPVSTMAVGSSTTCVAAVTGSGSYSSAVTWSANAGSITSGGLLTASTTATSVTVVATSNQDPTKSGAATITLTQPSTIKGLNISCPGLALPVGKSMPCTAAITGTGNPSLGVVWSTSAGTITQAGVVTAPLAGTTLTVTATSTQDPTKSGVATLQIVPNLAIINPTFFATPTTIVVSWNVTQSAYSGVNYDDGPGTPYSTTPAATAPSAHASFTFTGLTPGTTYNATIFSTNQWGTVSMKGSATTPLK